MRMFAERQAINAPIQGSAADVIRRAMIRMDEACTPALELDVPLVVDAKTGRTWGEAH